MGVHVILEKESEDETQVSYRYGPSLDRLLGMVRLDLVAERFVEVDQPGTASVVGESRAARSAVVRAFIAGQGYPERLALQS